MHGLCCCCCPPSKHHLLSPTHTHPLTGSWHQHRPGEHQVRVAGGRGAQGGRVATPPFARDIDYWPLGRGVNRSETDTPNRPLPTKDGTRIPPGPRSPRPSAATLARSVQRPRGPCSQPHTSTSLLHVGGGEGRRDLHEPAASQSWPLRARDNTFLAELQHARARRQVSKGLARKLCRLFCASDTKTPSQSVGLSWALRPPRREMQRRNIGCR
jgi:hypothetical protein